MVAGLYQSQGRGSVLSYIQIRGSSALFICCIELKPDAVPQFLSTGRSPARASNHLPYWIAHTVNVFTPLETILERL